MRFQPSVVQQLMQPVSRPVFKKATPGRAKWGLTDWAHLVVLVAAQMAGVRSLRDLVGLLAHHRGALRHLEVEKVHRSTLSDANRTRPTGPFEAVAAQLSAMVGQWSRGLGQEALRLIDATRIHAGQAVRHWAVDGSVKLHVVLDPVLQRVVCFAVTCSRVNDITPAKSFPIEKGLTYVFDRGYYDFGFWAKLNEAGCRFVTRLKSNTPVTTMRTRRIPNSADHVLEDRTGLLPKRLAASRRNPYQAAVRVIAVRIDNGRVLHLVTNDLQSPASEIARLYKARWDIELFFKWVKQNLKLQHFLGSSRNAVALQILAALIAFLLVRLAQLRAMSALAAQAAFRIISTALMQRRPIDELLHPPPPKPPEPASAQLAFVMA
jgi:hypothetical protein